MCGHEHEPVAPQKWTNFYLKVLTKLVSRGEVKLNVSIEAKPKESFTDQQVEEIKAALLGLGLNDNVKTERLLANGLPYASRKGTY